MLIVVDSFGKVIIINKLKKELVGFDSIHKKYAKKVQNFRVNRVGKPFCKY